MKTPFREHLRIVAVLLLVGALVAVSLVPNFTGNVSGATEDPASSSLTTTAPPLAESAALRGATNDASSALAHQAAKRGLDVEAPPVPTARGDAPLPPALDALARTTGVDTGTPAWETTRADAAALPADLQRPLATLVLASAHAHELQQEALSDLSPEEVQALADGKLSPSAVQHRVDMKKSLQAALLLDAAMKDTRPDLVRWGILLDQANPTRLGLQPGENLFQRQLDPVQLVRSIRGSDGPEDLLRGVAHLQGNEITSSSMPPELQEATLTELLVTTYRVVGLPLDLETRAAFQAVTALDPAVQTELAQNLRHLLHSTKLREEAFQELTPRERALATGQLPLPVDPSDGVNATEQRRLDAVQTAVSKVNMTKLTQAGLELARSSLGPQAQSQHRPIVEDPVRVACPVPEEAPPVGAAPVDVGEPLTCTVGNVRVTVEITRDDQYRLIVDTNNDGNPELSTTTSNVIRVHLDPDTYGITVYEDANGDGFVQDREKEFEMDGIRDANNNVGFVDPFGFIIVGGVDAGATLYDDRYGRDRYPEVRDARLETTRATVDDQANVLDGFPPLTSAVPQSTWEALKAPSQAIINPNSTQILTLDLGGDSVYSNNAGGTFPLLVRMNVTTTESHYQPYFQSCPWRIEVDPTEPAINRFSCRTSHDEGWVTVNVTYRGPALALDRGGNDTYQPRAELNFTMGAARAGGVGVLVDEGPGNDMYTTPAPRTLGAAEPLAVGLALDLGGDDTVDVADRSLGATMPLSNVCRDIFFFSACVGSPSAPSVAMYYDAWGNDTVTSKNRTQAYAGNYGSTALFVQDGSGNDTFTLTERRDHVYGQGAAYAGALALFLTEKGNDTYHAPEAPDVDSLEDKTDDTDITWQGADVSRIQGKERNDPRSAAAPGVGLLVDLAGEDTGIRHTTTITHPPTGTYRLGWQYPTQKHGDGSSESLQIGHPATGLAVDAELHDPTARESGFLVDTGQVRWNETRDPIAGSTFVLTVPSLLGVGDSTATEWTDSYVVSVDLGGDDSYKNRPGAASLLPPQHVGPHTSDVLNMTGSNLGLLPSGHLSLTGHPDWRPKLASLHVDVAGNDLYRGEGNLTTQPQNWTLGSGILATAAFHELGGHDTYRLDGRGLGHGTLGVGLFQDDAGNDHYNATDAARGGTRGLGHGSIGGYGVFADRRGADHYVAGDWSLGSYEFMLRQPGLKVRESLDASHPENLDDRNLEHGAGVFVEGEGFDRYETTLRSLGYAEDEADLTNNPTVRGLHPAAEDADRSDPRGLVAVFVDDGFGNDTYPVDHRDIGHENNAHWSVNHTLAQGVDNVDFLLHSSIVQNGGEPVQRLLSLLLSPSVELETPVYGTSDHNGTVPVTFTVSYGGNRTTLLNARSLAIAPLHVSGEAGADAGVDTSGVIDTVQEIRDMVTVPDVGNVSASETGHFGVEYTRLTYESLLNVFLTDGDDGEGFTEEWHETNRAFLQEAGAGDHYDHVVSTHDSTFSIFYGFYDTDNEFSGYRLATTATQQTVQNGSAYADGEPMAGVGGIGAGDGIPHPCSVSGDACITDDHVFTTGHDAVDLAAGSSAGTALTFQEVQSARASADLLLLLKAVAPTLEGGDHVGAAADEALAEYGAFRGESQPAPAPLATETPAGTDDGGPDVVGCTDLGDGYAQNAILECSIRAVFHRALENDLPTVGGLDPLNDPQNPEFVRKVELVVDGVKVAEAVGDPSENTYTLNWTSDALNEDGIYRFPDTDEDGRTLPHLVTAKAYYRPTEDRTTNPDGDTYDPRRTSDPYGFYPGTDVVRVTTDHKPRLEENRTTDFNPDPDKSCTGTDLNCHLDFRTNVSEPVNLTMAVLRSDGTEVVTFNEREVLQNGTPDLHVPQLWDGTANGAKVADGLYYLRVTATERTADGNRSVTSLPFYVERDDPVTRPDPAGNDRGYTGLGHLWIHRGTDGAVENASNAYALNVTAVIQQNVHSPLRNHDLFVRVVDTDGTHDSEATQSLCSGDVNGHSANWNVAGEGWCKVRTGEPGDRSTFNVTRKVDGRWKPLDGVTLEFVSNGTDRAGNVEKSALPTAEGGVESSTFIDTTRPVTSLDLNTSRLRAPTLSLNYTVQDGPLHHTVVEWDLQPAGEDSAAIHWKRLPADLVDRKGSEGGTLRWDPGHPGVNATLDDGAVLLLRVRAVDMAGNLEKRQQPTAQLAFDFQGPTLAEAPNVTREPHAVTVNFTTVEPVPHASAVVWPADGNRSQGVEFNVTSFESDTVHEVRAAGLDAQTPYSFALQMEDIAGNTEEVVLNLSTSNVLQLHPIAPEGGSILTGEAQVSWRTTNVTGDLMVHYNLTMSPDGSGNCTVQVATAEYFEGTPARRNLGFDSSEVPSTGNAVFCLAANNTLNPRDPIMLTLPVNGTVAVDNEAPTTNLTTEGTARKGWFADPVTVRLATTDITPDGVDTHVAVDGSEPRVYHGAFVLESDGVHEVTYWSADRLGHVEEKQTEEVRVDRTPPRGNLTMEDGATRTAQRNVTLTLDLDDATSGIDRVLLATGDHPPRSIPGIAFRGGAVDVPWTLPAGDGPKEIRATVIDLAGNRATVRQAVHLDTSSPEVRGLSLKESGYTRAALRWSTDEPSTATVLYKESGSPAFQGQIDVERVGANHVVVLPNLTPGTDYEVRVLARDILTNVGTADAGFTTLADGTAPSGVRELQAEVLPSGYVELRWEPAFDQVGIDRYVVTRTDEGGSTTTVGSTPDEVLLDDTVPPGSRAAYRVHAVDVAENAGPMSRAVEVHATSAPRILDDNVTPSTGEPGATYTYRVVVQDRDGDVPAYVRVFVDGEAHNMRRVDPSEDIRHGAAFEYSTTLNTTTLSQGVHTYRFVVSDGPHTVASHPADEPASGPMVLADTSGESTGFAASVQRLVPGPGVALVALAAAAALLVLRPTRRCKP